MAGQLRLGFLANHDSLVKKLDTESLLPNLISSGLISLEERELISHEATGSDKTDRLLMILHRRGTINPDIFNSLFDLLSDESVTAGQLLDDVLKKIKADSCDDKVIARFVSSSDALKVGDNVSSLKFEDIVSALNVKEVLPQLVSYGIVNLSENDQIRSKPLQRDQAKELLAVIKKGGTSAFDKFVEVLLGSDTMSFLGKRLRKETLEDDKQYEEVQKRAHVPPHPQVYVGTMIHEELDKLKWWIVIHGMTRHGKTVLTAEADMRHYFVQLSSEMMKMEGKFLGRKNIAGRVNNPERADDRKEMIEHKPDIHQQLEAKEESILEIKGTFASLQEEVDSKTKKLNKLKSKLKASRAEKADSKEENISVRKEMVVMIEVLQKELKLRTLIVENYIPTEEVEKITQRAFYDEDTEEWKLKPLKPPASDQVVVSCPVSTIGNLRPISLYARMAARNGDPRYMAQNILKMELDMPNRTTRDYEGCHTLQDALETTLQDEQEVVVDALAFTSEDQLRVKLGPRTRRQGKQQANHSSKEHRTLTTDPHDQKREQGGEERVQKGREPKSTSESIAPFTHSNPD